MNTTKSIFLGLLILTCQAATADPSKWQSYLGKYSTDLLSNRYMEVMIEKGELAEGYYIVQVRSNKGILYAGKLLVKE